VAETSQEARESFDTWLETIRAELDRDHATDPAALADLERGMVEAFGRWRITWGYGLAGRGTGPETPIEAHESGSRSRPASLREERRGVGGV
jgi:hypothetical protein